jgi:ABC-type antimicrobial peptide transport system permease subunit
LLVAIGLVIGAPATFAGDRLAATMFYGLHGDDPIGLIAAVLVLLLVATIAGYLPARRASKVDLMQALGMNRQYVVLGE